MDYGQDSLKKWRWICFAIAVALIAFFYFRNGSRRTAVPGIREPIQGEAKGDVPLKRGKYSGTITFIKSYDISGIVVSTKKYSGTSLADVVSNKDVALAWGKVAEYNKKIDFHWKQSGRWCNWNVDDLEELNAVGGVDGVTKQVSNNHLIPANTSAEKLVKKIKTGDYVRITGYLVNVDATDSSGNSYWWHSSTSRDDSGDGACEIIYVNNVEWLR